LVRVSPCHTADSGEWIGALRHQLGAAVFGEPGHHDEDRLGSDGEVHRAADRRDRVRCSGMPAGQVAGPGDLERPQDTDIEMAAAHHGEGVGVMEVLGAGQLGHGDLAGVGQVGVDLVTDRGRTHSEHAVLGVQHDAAGGSEVVGDRGRLPDPEVDVGPGWDVASHHRCELASVQRSPIEVLDHLTRWVVDGRVGVQGRARNVGHGSSCWPGPGFDRSSSRLT